MKMGGYRLLIDLMNSFPLYANIYFIFGQPTVIISVSMLYKLQALEDIEPHGRENLITVITVRSQDEENRVGFLQRSR